MIKFIHAADLHLDSPFKGLKDVPEKMLKKIKESTFQSLQNIVDQAIKHEVDFVLFAGDIYDIEDRSIKAQVLFKKEMIRLKDHGIPVCLVHGNHDYQANKDVHLSLSSNVEVFPPNVKTVEIESKSGETVSVSGFSYDRKWIDERKIQDYPKRSSQTDYHIGLLHGYAEGQQSEHARYAPFTLSELKQKDYDYWALGHIHKRQQVSENPLAFYSGNPQGRNKKETGEKGCLLIELSPSSSDVTFLPTASIIWKNVLLNVTSLTSMNDIFETVKEAVMDQKESNCLISLTIVVSSELAPSMIKKLEQLDFYEAVQLYTDDFFVYIVDTKVTIEQDANQAVSLENVFPTAWSQALDELHTESLYNQETDELYNSFTYSKYLNKRNSNYRDEIITKAINLLLQDLGVEEGVNNDY